MLLAAPLPCRGFLPPSASGQGVRVTIVGVPETVPVVEGVQFTVLVEQTVPRPVQGDVRVALNEDWEIIGPAAAGVGLPGKGTAEVTFRAKARDRVLEALYPVHAWAELRVGGHPVFLHPIALFKAVLPRKPAAESPQRPSLTGNEYHCLRAAGPIRVDGGLEEWTNAAPVPCNAEKQATGKITADSFDGVFFALHDADNLYFGLRAADDEISCEDDVTEDFMNSDYLRLYLSALDPKQRQATSLDENDMVLAVSVFGAGDKPRVKRPTYGLPLRRQFGPGSCALAARRTAVGYNVEIAIPKTVLAENLSDGAALGCNVMIGDADEGRRRGEITLGRRIGRYWLSPDAYFRLVLSPDTESVQDPGAGPPLIRLSRRAWRLERLKTLQVSLTRGARTRRRPVGWQGYDRETGATFAVRTVSRDGVSLPAIAIHPPYRGGKGPVWGEYALELPDCRPIVLEFRTAIRDHAAHEPPSDGVEFKVLATPAGGDERELFRRFSDAKTWQPASVDLAPFAGKRISLKLWAGPGPKGDTTCDSGFWGGPTIIVGRRREPVTEETWKRREREALALARAALRGKPPRGAWRLEEPNQRSAAGLVPGEQGLIDGVLVFSTAESALAFRGFRIEIDGDDVGDPRSEISLLEADTAFSRGGARVTHVLDWGGKRLQARAGIDIRQGGLSVRFSTSGVRRNLRGNPRYTRLALGPAGAPLHRVYAGFGNVIEKPEDFVLTKGGFRLSTRHVGADYENGLSLLQATDVFPDQVVCRPGENTFSLEACHDVTFLFIPSEAGSFAAARHYRDLAGFKPGRGVRNLLGRVCLDQWGGDYGKAAEGVERAAAYGLTHSVFVKHVWQRWGYDYRLPEIYPPAHGLEAFRAMPEACARHGILFAPHDNYIDFYPDAEAYSYDHIIFNRDGTPQRAWYNKGRKAQSYRWLPHAFMPWLKENMRLMRNGFQPTSLFIDVFSAMPPIDYYDRSGRFYTRERTAEEWGRAFDVSRRILGRGAPMLSEAGHDGLVGALDGGQADHYDAEQWGVRGAAACRTPWHDMATHGSFVLLAGGLGHRYGNRDEAHTYGTDDYLSNTVMGGRNPMCDGPFSRRAVMTYWLLHDVCDALARASFEEHRFGGDSVHRQHTTFGDGSRVWVNRGEPEWEVGGLALPKYGFLVRTPHATAAVCRIDGQRVAYARSPGVLFVDARPPFLSADRRNVGARVLKGEHLGGGKFRITVEWEVVEPLAPGLRPFVHIGHAKAKSQGERIAHHGTMDLPKDALTRPGRIVSTITAAVPPDSFGGEYLLRYGVYKPGPGGYRVPLRADLDGSRVRGGKLFVTIEKGKILSAAYVPETPLAQFAELNRERRMMDFGPIVTNGAFRLTTPGREDWRLVPLPWSIPFRARIRLGAFERGPEHVAGVETIDARGRKLADAPYELDGKVLQIDSDARAFGRRIRFR